jgi:hypothetical protein
VQMLNKNIDWNRLEVVSSREEVMCEAMYFYGLIDFEHAIACVNATTLNSPTCRAFSNFVADMYFGEIMRPDFSYEGDAETRKWLDDIVKEYDGAHHPITTSMMRRFTSRIRGKMDDELWTKYMRAMMTIHLSGALLWSNMAGMKDLYEYLVENGIQDEFIFVSRELDPLEPGQTVQSGHFFLRTFKLDPTGETATMGIINSGDGLQFHDMLQFKLNELPDTISMGDPRATSGDRYIPFIIFEKVPRQAWSPAYTVTNSMDDAYFNHKLKKHKFDDYKLWQYIDVQRAGTCTAMSL